MIPTLQASGIVLRALVVADAPALFIAMSDPVAQRYRNQLPHRDISETERYIENTLARGIGWAITSDGHEALGRIALRVDGESGEIGIIVRPAAHGRGLGAAAVRLVEAYAGDVLGLREMRATIDAENAASLRLFEKSGFIRRQIVQEDTSAPKGPRDIVLLSKDVTA